MKHKAWVLLILGGILILGLSCLRNTSGAVAPPAGSYILPTEDGAWTPAGSNVGRKPEGKASIRIQDTGTFVFEASEVETLRPDVFQPGHFSVFDVLVYLHQQGNFDLEYHFDRAMDTHIIDAIDGEPGWWYRAEYSGGWFESNSFRMDMYPYKNGTQILVYKEGEDRLARIYKASRDEVERLATNDGEIVIPEVVVRSPGSSRTFQDVVVTAHDVRSDVLQPGTVTSLDVLLSLGEQGEISRLKLSWYDRIGDADPVDSYWVEQIDGAEASGGCGFVYETGPRDFEGFAGNHIHIPADARVIVSPEYALWFWICL